MAYKNVHQHFHSIEIESCVNELKRSCSWIKPTFLLVPFATAEMISTWITKAVTEKKLTINQGSLQFVDTYIT